MSIFFQNNSRNQNPIGGFVGLIFGAMMLVGLFFIGRAIFRVLYMAAPFLLALALIINYKVVVNFIKGLLSLVDLNPFLGILSFIGVFLFFPFVTAHLFFKAIRTRNRPEPSPSMFDQMRQQSSPISNNPADQFVEYEEITDYEVVNDNEVTEEDLPESLFRKDSY